MKTTRILYFTVLWMGMTFSAFAQGESRGPMATSAIGHMAVTLLSPATLTSAQNIEFNDISLRSVDATSAVADYDMSRTSIRVSGTHATYAVTVTNKKLGFSQNGKTLSVSNFSSVSTMDETGVSNIYFGATIRISKKEAAAVAETSSPLAVIINYN